MPRHLPAIRSHIGLDWTNGQERHASVHLVGPDGYAVACINVVQFADDPVPRLRGLYYSSTFNKQRPGWLKARDRFVLRAFKKSTPFRI